MIELLKTNLGNQNMNISESVMSGEKSIKKKKDLKGLFILITMKNVSLGGGGGKYICVCIYI